MRKTKVFLEANSMENFIEQHNKLITFEWQIREETLKKRASNIKLFPFKKEIKDTYKNKIDKNIKDVEIVTYCDVMVLMKRLIEDYLEKRKTKFKDIHFYMEMVIPYSEGKRIDFVIAFKKTIILLEFSYSRKNDEDEDYNKTYHEKLNQVIHYQTLLSNVIDPSIKVVPYVFLYNPEYDNFKNKINSNNEIKLDEFAELIEKLYLMDSTAIEEINKLKD